MYGYIYIYIHTTKRIIYACTPKRLGFVYIFIYTHVHKHTLVAQSEFSCPKEANPKRHFVIYIHIMYIYTPYKILTYIYIYICTHT
jgi:hypothetical protein